MRYPKPLDCGKFWFKNKQAPIYPILVNFVLVIKTSPLFQCNFREEKYVTQIKSLRASGPSDLRDEFGQDI